jgi:D-alanine--poly(phosphoribitol) ligase subunit 2
MTTSDKVLDVLKIVTETEEVGRNLDIALYDLQILDSMKTVELIVALSDQFGIEISPAEFERERWATPRLIISDITDRLGA